MRLRRLLLWVVLTGMVAFVSPVRTESAEPPAAAKLPAPPKPKVGARAPDFALKADDGKTYRLRNLRGQWVVLAFYPKDFTGG